MKEDQPAGCLVGRPSAMRERPEATLLVALITCCGTTQEIVVNLTLDPTHLLATIHEANLPRKFSLSNEFVK